LTKNNKSGIIYNNLIKKGVIIVMIRNLRFDEEKLKKFLYGFNFTLTIVTCLLEQNSTMIVERPTEEIYGLVEHQEDYSSTEEKLKEESEYLIAQDSETLVSESKVIDFDYNEQVDYYLDKLPDTYVNGYYSAGDGSLWVGKREYIEYVLESGVDLDSYIVNQKSLS
jgi:hypothetical protein